jgi:hypothetical protein
LCYEKVAYLCASADREFWRCLEWYANRLLDSGNRLGNTLFVQLL